MSKLILVYAHGGITNDPGAVNDSVKPVQTEREWIKTWYDSYLIPELKARNIAHKTIQQTEWWKIDTQVDAIYEKGDIAVSCHLNAGEADKASGSETLYCKGSTNGEKLAKLFNDTVVKVLGDRNRGLKPIQWDRVKPRVHDDRGGRLVCGTKPPCILLELFFLSNDADLADANAKRKDLAKAFVDTYVSFRNTK